MNVLPTLKKGSGRFLYLICNKLDSIEVVHFLTAENLRRKTRLLLKQQNAIYDVRKGLTISDDVMAMARMPVKGTSGLCVRF